VPAETEMETVHAQLNRISDDLGVDIHLDSPEMTVP
jgi:glycine cleavage system regulatory protein